MSKNKHPLKFGRLLVRQTDIAPANMAGIVINPVPVTGTVNISNGQTPSPSHFNSLSVSAGVDRLLAHVRGGSCNSNNEIFNLCISLSRCIDNAVANNEIPARAPDLPYLLKQVCQFGNGTPLKAVIMVLMISIKSACRNGWFNEKDNEELLILSNEIATSFCTASDTNFGETTFHHNISAVMSRFYPRMKMGEILAFVEATPGYGAFVKDFIITNNAKSSDDKIYLFVAQIDNTETSSCITSPQQVNFLLNGKAVDWRSCVCKDPGPQIPTLLTNMLKFGTNLLQAVGQFNGNYIILVAFMSMVSNPSCPTLADYVTPVADAAPDLDNDIIEGPSRISLNCPISFKRIKTPVKGHLCKHLQCFDFDNYVDINTRRPSWRCPHCSQSVCYSDIRIDQGMVKVLQEVGVNVSHVKISSDGSWEALNGNDDHTDTPQDKPSLHRESTDILDLTGVDNNIDDASDSRQEIDKKPSIDQLQDVNMTDVHRNITSCMDNRFWRSHLPMDTVVNATSLSQSQLPASNNMQFPTHVSQGQSQLSALNSMQLPTHSIGTSNNVTNGNLQGQSQLSASNNMQLPTHVTQGQSQLPASNSMQLPTYAIGTSYTVGNANSQGQSQLSASNNMQLPTHSIGTSNNVANGNLLGQSQLSASDNMQLLTYSIGTSSTVRNANSQGQNQLSASNNMQLTTHSIGTSNNVANGNLQGQSQLSASNSMQLPTYSIGTSNTVGNANSRGQSQLSVSNNMQLQTHVSQGQSQLSASNSMQLPTHSIGTSNTVTDGILHGQSQSQCQSQFSDSNSMSNEYGRYPTPAKHMTRIPVVTLALPAQTSAGMVSGESQQQFSRFHMDPHQIMRMISAQQSQNMAPQNWIHHDRSSQSQPVQQFGGPPHQSNGYPHTSGFNPHQHQHQHQHQHPSLNQMILDSMWPSQVHQGVVGPTSPTTGNVSNQQAHHYTNATAQQTIHTSSWTPSMPMASLEHQRGQGQGQTPMVLDGSTDTPSDQNWRPTGRMRGSLSGRAYSEALNQYMIHPTQPVQASRPPLLNSPRPVIPPHLQVLMANNRNAHSYEDGVNGSVLNNGGGSGGGGGGAGGLPDH